MAYEQRKISFLGTVDANPETKPFWDACAAGKLVLPRCKDTGKFIWYPRAISPFTFGPVEWVEVSGKGTIYTFSVMRRNTPVPYAIGYVTLDEGVSLLTNFIDCDFDALKIGQRVRIKWSGTGDGNPPVFTFTTA